MHNYALAIHGGAGTILQSTMTPEKELAYKTGLQDAIEAGESILKSGGSAFDAVESAIIQLENNPLFNAGKGAVFTNTGTHEMDASIMNGKDLMAGAIAGVQGVKNPISLARAVMEKSEHVLLTGNGAMDFAKKVNAPFENEEYFFVQLRYDQLQQAKQSNSMILDHTEDEITSTGGMTNKQFGRVGDSSIIGAGTYANNNTCAISCTGHGELFIRSVVAYDISCLMEYKNLSLKEACDIVVMDKLVKIGGEGGLIALDAKGNIVLPFNSEGMYRASKKQNEDIFIGIYK